MTDSLPLIPGKSSKVCTDVKPVLRGVFQKLDILPPLVVEGRDKTSTGGSGDTNKDERWIELLKTECKEILNKEGELKQQYAKRLARDPLPNIYKLHEKKQPPEVTKERYMCQHDKTKEEIQERRLQERMKQEMIQRSIMEKMNQAMKIQRGDLMPTIAQNADGEQTLWIKNILNRSSGDLSPVQITGSRIHLPINLTFDNNYTDQSLSLGEVVVRPPPPPPPVPPTPPLREYIICIPPQIHFVNFTVGHLHTQSLRLVNVSSFEVRLSVRPPERHELDIEIYGQRGLCVTSGADTELRIHFRPHDVRVLRDELHVRVSAGKSLLVPISCYMQPPLLNILVPSVSTSVLFCTPDDGCEKTVTRGTDVIELGARLLGDVHSVQVLFQCDAKHVAFFILTEDAWLSFNLQELTVSGSLLAGPFVMSPAWWRGGGEVRGRAWCRAQHCGLQAVALRLLCSTAVMRPLHLLADSLYYKHDHLIIEAQDRNYDICSDDDPACQYYVHLGTAFPHRSLSATVQLINRSPVMYSFYWSIRPWGVCSCWAEMSEDVGSEFDSEEYCIGAKERIQKEQEGTLSYEPLEHANLIHVEPSHGSIAPRSSVAMHVRAPDAGGTPGTRRAVLMLVQKDIPKESFPKGFNPMIVRTASVNSDPIPGVKGWTREVCEVICGQMEVWWEVAPVRFVIDPPVLPIIHSRRVDAVALSLRATQLFGTECVTGEWIAAPHVTLAAPHTVLSPANSHTVDVNYKLPSLPNDYPETDIITLKAANNEWQFSTTVTRSCATRHPALLPPRAPLGVVRPGADMRTTLKVLNDTHQHICWWATVYRWMRERTPADVCLGRVPCADCGERACSCALLSPTRGALQPGDDKNIQYRVVAPDDDGCVATLVQVRRTGADVAHVLGGAGSTARASLISYRVLAPRLALRALQCCSSTSCTCTGSQLDPGGFEVRARAGASPGTAVLRPLGSLTLLQRSCYKLRFTNFTPIPTRVKWDEHLENDILKVIFIPNEFDVGEYANVEIKVVIEALKVTGRRMFVVRADVAHACSPLYLLIDAAVSGLEIVCEIPVGGEEKTDSKFIMKIFQREEGPWDAGKQKFNSPEDIFAEWDRIRAQGNVCRCSYSMEYIPPSPSIPIGPPASDDSAPLVQIVWEPPKLTAVCECFHKTLPIVPELEETLCLQFKGLPLYTVRSRTICIRNVSVVTARWSAVVRRWPRVHNKGLSKDEWLRDVSAPGVILQCRPSSGQLLARDSLHLHLEVYADCWGLYRDQLLLKVENLPPIVIDVWIEAVGSPLLFALTVSDVEAVPVVWFSSSDPERIVRVKNTSRSALTIYPYVVTEHEHVQDVLPFRLYIRYYDVPIRTCPCVAKFEAFIESIAGEFSVETPASSVVTTDPLEVDTMLELCITADYGIQCDQYFEVSPSSATVEAGAWHEWHVTLHDVPEHDDLAPPTTLLLRSIPVHNSGPCWYRGPVPPAAARLRHAARAGCLRLSCRDLIVQMSALDLPIHDVMRVRKRFHISNLGSLRTVVQACVEEPWRIVVGSRRGPCGAGCCRAGDGARKENRDLVAMLDLMPRSSAEICVEVSVPTMSVWPVPLNQPCGPGGVCRPGRPCGPGGPCLLGGPCAPPAYSTQTRTVTKLLFYDNDALLLTLPLILELEFPMVSVEPALINFGFVTDGDTRKTYFTVTHSSRKETLELVSEWVGPEEFRLWPRRFTVAPGAAERLYLQYTAKWRSAPVEGCARVSAACGAGAWCHGSARARAAPARDLGAARDVHDHTDDPHLLPPDLPGAGAPSARPLHPTTSVTNKR